MTSTAYRRPHSRTLPHQYHHHHQPTTAATSSSSSSSSFSSATPATTTSMIDGTWEISVYIDGLDLRRIRVRGDLHVGGLMLKVVDGLELDRDWSDFAIWWPKKNKWLHRMRSTLDQYDIQAGTLLHFLPVHSHLYVQLPDLQILQMRVDFSADLFSVVIRMCRQLGIRHPEELSLSLPMEKDDLKKDQGLPKVTRSKSQYDVVTSDLNDRTMSRDSLTSCSSSFMNRSSNLNLSSAFLRGSFYGNRNSGRFSLRKKKKSLGTLTRTISTPLSPSYVDGTLSRNTFDANSTFVSSTRASSGCLFPQLGHDLASSPWVSASEASEVLLKPKNLSEKARINAGWLDSSKSLMEQSVFPSSLVLLKFKFYAFYDLNPLNDCIRINQLFEQAKWSVLTGEIECTREEMVVFAALQLHIHQSQNPSSLGHLGSTLTSALKNNDYDLCRTPEDIIDAALSDLQMSLEGNNMNFPAPFSTRTKSGFVGRSSCSNGYNYPTIPYRSLNHASMPTTNSAYSISSSSSSPFYPASSSNSRYDFNLNGVLGVGPLSDHPLPYLIQDITQVPELRGCLRFYRPKRFFLKSYKKQPFMFRDLTLSMFRTVHDPKPIWSLELKGCEVTSEVLLSGRKYVIKLMVPLNRGADEIWFKMDDEEQYVSWLAGMKLACRGRTMADVPSFQEEVALIQEKMAMLGSGKHNKNNDHNHVFINNNNKNNMSSNSTNNNANDNNGDYASIGPKTSPVSDYHTFTRDSRRRSFLNKFKKDRRDSSESDLTDGVKSEDTILRSKVKERRFSQPIRNGLGGSSQPINGHQDGEEESYPGGRSQSRSESLISIPKSLRGSCGMLFGNMAPRDFLAPRFCRRSKLKQMLHKISESVEEMRDMNDLESKLTFIKAWQSLPDFGYSYFIIKFKGSKKEDILALTPSKMVLMEGGSHEVMKRWRYQDLRSWSVNWEVKQVKIEFEEEEMIFQCQSSDCKAVHEFIGGYIFLSMRSPEHNHKLNQELFHKLTGGWT